MKRTVRRAALVLALVLLLGLSACGNVPETQKAEGTFTLTFITVGKGDAFLLTGPDGSTYMMDTGKLEDYPQIARTLRLKGIDCLAGIFLSHGHKDHAGGLDALLTAFPTERVYLSGVDTVSYTDIDARAIAHAHGVPVEELTGGETISLGGAQGEVWVPARVDAENANNNSILLRITHGDTAFLLMGDAEEGEEQALLQTDFPLRADVLKLGHHGEDDASTPAFLDRVQPDIALVAGNAEENPESVNAVVEDRLQERDIQTVFSEGPIAIDFISDGTAVTRQDVEDEALPAVLAISFAQVDRKGQRVTVRNDGGEEVLLDGCVLQSVRGDELYFFPDGVLLAPGETVSVACAGKEQPGDLVWHEEKVWKKNRDTARLYDQNMNLLAEDAAA